MAEVKGGTRVIHFSRQYFIKSKCVPINVSDTNSKHICSNIIIIKHNLKLKFLDLPGDIVYDLLVSITKKEKSFFVICLSFDHITKHVGPVEYTVNQ